MNESPTNWKILFVDDSLTEINYLKLFFQFSDAPLTPQFIHSAPKALEALKGMNESEFPEIIVVDINMPLMDGFEFADTYIKTYRQNHPNTKLFIYSTSIHSADIRRVESIEGVSGFIPKPFSDNTFKEYIQPHLNAKIEVIKG